LHIPSLQENYQLLADPEALQVQVSELKRLMLKANLLSQDIDLRASHFGAEFLPEGR